MRDDLPTGTVTLLFTDVEGSTRLLAELGAEGYAALLGEHHRIVAETCVSCGGVVVDTEGDAFFVAFRTAPEALAAAEAAQRALASIGVRVRIGVHTGAPLVAETGYVGIDVHRAARISASAHGGQIVVSASTRQLADERFELVDLGEHRLKDLPAAERLFQLGAGRFPPLKSLNQTNLPAVSTSLVGREREIEAVLGLLRRDDVSVVTLTGVGGSGKSRLALELATAIVEDYRDGVWFVSLAALADASLVIPAVAQALGLREGEGTTYREVLAEYLHSRRMLLVLDNLEQLLPDVATVIGELVLAARDVDLLGSSREPLRIAAEHEYPVLPLPPSDATRLFAHRASSVRPGFSLDCDRPIVEAICTRLDGLPLAIELAAARVKVLSPAKLLERLERRLPLLTGGARDAPERQRTLRATIAWSHDLLDELEHRLFARLSVFLGGCHLEAAEAVCDADIDTLSSLIDKNLVRQNEGPHDEPRYTMLETIAEFALERLDEMGDAEETRRRHAEHFVAFGLAAEPELTREDQRRWLDLLDAERENLRGALRWSLNHDPELALRLAVALVMFWYTRGQVREGRDWLLTALELASPTPSHTRALALDWSGYLCTELGEDGRALTERAIACAREAEAPAALALALSHLSMSLPADRWDEAASLGAEARAIAERAGDPFILGIALNNLGVMVSLRGDAETAQALAEESYRVRSLMGDNARMALSLGNLAEGAMDLGDTAAAHKFASQGLELARRVGHRREIVFAITTLAWIALDENRVDGARGLFEDALALSYEIAKPSSAPGIVLGLAAVAAATGDGPRAARLAAAGEHAIATRFPYAELAPAQARLADLHLAAVRDRTSPAEWDAACKNGTTISIEELTAEVLDQTSVARSRASRSSVGGGGARLDSSSTARSDRRTMGAGRPGSRRGERRRP